MTTAILSPVFKQSFKDNNGNPLYLGTLGTFAAGTTNPISTYTDSTGSTPNANPIVLNTRGECDCWVLPNVAYKFQLKDSAGNIIWTVDNVINSQLITLYGGVDTGGANAYVVNYTSSFTSLSDGIVVFFVASNTNTGASTLNVNGLGIVNIVNSDSSALRANQILVNQVVQVMYKGGNWILLAGSFASGVLAVAGASGTPSIAFLGDTGTGFYHFGTGLIGIALNGVATGTISTGTVAGVLTGVSGTVNITVSYSIMNNICVLRVPQVSGTSNSTSFGMTFTGSSVIRPSTSAAQYVTCSAMEDNGAGIYSQVGFVAQGGLGITNFTFYKNGSASGWTNAGTKGIGDGGGGNVANIFVYPLS